MGAGGLIGGKYDLVRQLGTGVLGSVWEAEEPTAGARVALKLMSCPTDELCERILDEARLAQSVVFPSLVKILAVGEAREREPFVAMELLSGETLAERLAREGKLPPRLAAQIGRDIAGALSTAHAARLVHGDLRPANIFLAGEPGTPTPTVKVFDLWMARALGPEVAEAMGLDSPLYKSPEQLSGGKAPDVRSDLWSLGVLLFEMVAGKNPFGAGRRKPSEIAEAVATAPLEKLSALVPDVDAALEEIVSRCLERERDKRIGSTMVVTHMLDSIAEPSAKKAPAGKGSSSSSGSSPVALASATELFVMPPRGQLGTLVMDPGGPPPSSGPLSPQPAAPVSGPLGTMVMGPGSGPSVPLPGPRPEASGQSSAPSPSPREQLATQVFPEGYEPSGSFSAAPGLATTPPPPNGNAPHAPAPQLSTLTSARGRQLTETALHPSPSAATSGQRAIMIAVVVGAVLLVLGVVIILFVAL